MSLLFYVKQHSPWRTAQRLALGLLCVALAGAMGCSSSEPEPVAQTPAPAPSAMIAMDRNEDAAEDNGGEAYGGGSYSEEAVGEEDMSPMQMMAMSASGGPQGASPMMTMPAFAGRSVDEGDSGMGMGSSMMGMAGMSGMPGYGMAGNASPQFASALQFVRTNCISCHGPQQTKGDTRLDGLTDNFSDTGNATIWHAVLAQVESGQMPPADVTRRPDDRQQLATVAWIKSELVKSDFVPLEDRDYLSQAEYAFSHGQEGQASELLYAHAVAAEDDVAGETLSQARWFSLGLRPALSLRFAVGVDLDAPDSLEDLKPLGTSQAGGAGGGASMGMVGRGDGSGGGGANANTERTFEELTGDFGSALVTSFESRWMDGLLGTPFKDIEPAVPAAPANNAMGSNSMMGSMSGMMSGMEAMGRGGFPGSDGSAAGNATAAKHSTKGSVVTPGLVFIGTGKQADLLKQATDMGVDGLFLFDVKAAPKRRGGLVENSTRLRFVGLDGKTIAATSTLVNIDIERAKMRGHEDDSLSKNIDRLFFGFDEKVKLSSLPALKPEHAHDRIRALLVDPQVDTLVKLFEARLYRSLDLLSADELAKVYQIVLRGNEGLALATGSPEDRKLVLNQVLASQRK
jgi:mono/diheme cytochrome c family protein